MFARLPPSLSVELLRYLPILELVRLERSCKTLHAFVHQHIEELRRDTVWLRLISFDSEVDLNRREDWEYTITFEVFDSEFPLGPPRDYRLTCSRRDGSELEFEGKIEQLVSQPSIRSVFRHILSGYLFHSNISICEVASPPYIFSFMTLALGKKHVEQLKYTYRRMLYFIEPGVRDQDPSFSQALAHLPLSIGSLSLTMTPPSSKHFDFDQDAMKEVLGKVKRELVIKDADGVRRSNCCCFFRAWPDCVCKRGHVNCHLPLDGLKQFVNIVNLPLLCAWVVIENDSGVNELLKKLLIEPYHEPGSAKYHDRNRFNLQVTSLRGPGEFFAMASADFNAPDWWRLGGGKPKSFGRIETAEAMLPYWRRWRDNQRYGRARFYDVSETGSILHRYELHILYSLPYVSSNE